MFLVTHYWVDNIIIILVTLGCVCNHLITGTVITVTTVAPRRTPRHDIYIAYKCGIKIGIRNQYGIICIVMMAILSYCGFLRSFNLL